MRTTFRLFPLLLLIAALVLPLTFPVAAQDGAAADSDAPAIPVDVRQLVADNSEAAFDLYHRIAAGQSGNVFISPWSISQALQMTAAGADGETLDQMRQVFRMHLPDARLDAAWHDATALLTSEPGEDCTFELAIANALWCDDDEKVLASFRQRAEAAHGTQGVRTVDFADAVDAARQINAWADEETRGMIDHVVDPPDVEGAAMALGNAVYFNAKWARPFDPDDTRDEPFHCADGSTATVPMMHRTHSYRFAQTRDAECVRLPYDDSTAAMYVIMPTPGQFAAVERSLDAGKLDELVARMRDHRQIALGMPRFKFRWGTESLNDVLKQAGMPLAFDPAGAEFPHMLETRGERAGNLFISNVLHQAAIDVSEEGTEAAAVTVVVMGRSGRPPQPYELTIDRPFLYVIRDDATGAILFVGRMLNTAEAG